MNASDATGIAAAVIALIAMATSAFFARRSARSSKESAGAATRQADLAEREAARQAKLAEPNVEVTVSNVRLESAMSMFGPPKGSPQFNVRLVVSIHNYSSKSATVDSITVSYGEVAYYTEGEPPLKQYDTPLFRFPFIVEPDRIMRCLLEFNTEPHEPVQGDGDDGLVRVDCPGAKPMPFSVFPK